MKNTITLSNRKQLIFLALLLITIGLIVIFICVHLINSMKVTTHKETERYLEELSQTTALTVDSRMNMTFELLNSTSKTFLALEKDEPSAMRQYLKSMAHANYISWVSIVLKDGTIICSSNHTEHPIENSSGIKEAMKGKKVITRIRKSSENEEDGVIYTIPLHDSDGNIIGAVAAWSNLNVIREALNVESFNGEGYSIIINSNGDYLVNSQNKNALKKVLNIFDFLEKQATITEGNSLEEIYSIIKKRETGKMYYNLNSKMEKVVYFSPLDYDDLYLISVVPVQTAFKPMNDMLQQGLLSIFTVAITFIISLIGIFYTNINSQKKIERLAFHDSVTGGISKLYFDIEAKQLIQSSPPNTYRLIALNIQKFKLINDNFGNESGDKVLRHVYKSINGLLGSEELIARAASDNFYLLTKTKEKEEQIQTLNLYSKKINEFNIDKNKKYLINISLGVVLIDDLKLSLVQLCDRANIARKKAKNTRGKLITYVFYSDLERIQMNKEKDMENRMKNALNNEEFVVCLQPKIELQSNQIKGAEALVRWQNTEDGDMIPPNEFIPFFEKNGFIVELDIFVFEKTCALIRKWIDNGVEAIPISVNMSRIHFQNEDFLKPYKEIAERYKIPNNLLEIELTESIFFENIDTLITIINEIHKAGFKCALDDFGSGYSSLGILKDIHMDSLKIDKSFWNSYNHDNKRTKDIITSVVKLGQKLGMITVSEGVETIPQLEFLRNINCDMAQGYIFSKPVSLSEFEQLAFEKIITNNTD